MCSTVGCNLQFANFQFPILGPTSCGPPDNSTNATTGSSSNHVDTLAASQYDRLILLGLAGVLLVLAHQAILMFWARKRWRNPNVSQEFV